MKIVVVPHGVFMEVKEIIKNTWTHAGPCVCVVILFADRMDME
jgi:hypothetical protein